MRKQTCKVRGVATLKCSVCGGKAVSTQFCIWLMEILKTNNFIEDINPPVFTPRLTTILRRKIRGKGNVDPIGKQGDKHPVDDPSRQVECDLIGNR